MKPNKPGVWEWYDENNNRKLVNVVDVGYEDEPYLRVYFDGNYYDITKEFNDIEWPDRWGKYIHQPNSIPISSTYHKK